MTETTNRGIDAYITHMECRLPNRKIQHYMYNYWGRLYDRLVPFIKYNDRIKPFLTKALNYHLETTISIEERDKIATALRAIKKVG